MAHSTFGLKILEQSIDTMLISRVIVIETDFSEVPIVSTGYEQLIDGIKHLENNSKSSVQQ